LIIFWAVQAIYDFVLLQSLPPRILAGAGRYASVLENMLLRFLPLAIPQGPTLECPENNQFAF
jgi:hypothetical protein